MCRGNRPVRLRSVVRRGVWTASRYVLAPFCPRSSGTICIALFMPSTVCAMVSSLFRPCWYAEATMVVFGVGRLLYFSRCCWSWRLVLANSFCMLEIACRSSCPLALFSCVVVMRLAMRVKPGSVFWVRPSITSVMPRTVVTSLPTNGITDATVHNALCEIRLASAVCCCAWDTAVSKESTFLRMSPFNPEMAETACSLFRCVRNLCGCALLSEC